MRAKTDEASANADAYFPAVEANPVERFLY
jgi:hypothetical protein